MTAMSNRLVVALVLTLAFAGCKLKEAQTDIPAPPDVAAPPADAVRTPSGLASKVLQIGMSNQRPGPTSRVRVHYTGWTTDGKMFESTVPSGQPATFGVNEVIPGWTEGLQLMLVGEKRRFWIPGALAYDNIPDMPGAPPHPKGMLVFDIELLSVQ
jgi:peptidylprolyl isomerase